MQVFQSWFVLNDRLLVRGLVTNSMLFYLNCSIAHTRTLMVLQCFSCDHLDVSESVCCFMTPGLSEDIWCHGLPYYLCTCLQIISSDIRAQVKSVFSLVIVDGHFQSSFRSLCKCVWVNTLLSFPRYLRLIHWCHV